MLCTDNKNLGAYIKQCGFKTYSSKLNTPFTMEQQQIQFHSFKNYSSCCRCTDAATVVAAAATAVATSFYNRIATNLVPSRITVVAVATIDAAATAADVFYSKL